MPDESPLPVTERTRHRRLREQGSTDRADLSAILAAGAPQATVCVTVTHVDGLVLARSVFEHGVNYRSAMIYGTPRLVADREEKLAGLRALAEHIVPGQWDYARRPNSKELAKTSLLALGLAETSVKIRRGPPDDGDSPDAALPVWAGVLPLAAAWQDPEPDPVLPPGIPVPPHIAALARRQPSLGSTAAASLSICSRWSNRAVNRMSSAPASATLFTSPMQSAAVPVTVAASMAGTRCP